jgi:hypothetical protein
MERIEIDLYYTSHCRECGASKPGPSNRDDIHGVKQPDPEDWGGFPVLRLRSGIGNVMDMPLCRACLQKVALKLLDYLDRTA